MKSKSFFNILTWCLIFIIVLVLGLYVRFYPLRGHVWSDSAEQATALVIIKLRSMIAQQITSQAPNLSEAQRNQLIEEKFAQTLHQDSFMVRKTIHNVAQNLREESPETRERIYLQEADGYYYYDLTQNILKTGRLARQFKGSKYLNEKMAAPFGFWQPVNLHPYVGVAVYKTIAAFKPDVALMTALSFVGPLLSAVALLAFLGVCAILRCSPLASFIGAVYFYLAPIFVKRSTFAWYDDDSYNLIFPLLILGIVFKAIESVKNRRDAILYGITVSLLFAIYAFFWHGWGYTFAIIMASGFLILLTHHLLDLKFVPYRTQNKKPRITGEFIFFFAAILMGTLVLVSSLFGVDDFFALFKEGFAGLEKLTVNQLSLWPNLFIAVGELKHSSLKEIVEMAGGNAFWMICATTGVLLGSWLAFQRHDRTRIFQLIILTLFLLANLKITLDAERFMVLCLIPVSILGTLGLNSLVDSFRRIIHSSSLTPGKPKTIEIVLGILLIAGTIFFPIRSINAQIADQLSVIFNPTWEAALLDIKNKTPQDAIVTSWWPPGHFIKAIADRRVTFDGATITKNVESYWVANVFLTSDEHEAAGILRMLNTSGTKSIEYLESLGMKTSDAVSLLHYILPVSQDDAEEFLKRIMPADRARKLTELTHTQPPPSYLLLYSELMEKNIGLQFVAKWNFRQMEELNKNPEALKKLPPANSPDFFEFLWTTMGGPYKYSEAFISVAQNGKHIEFDGGIRVDLDTMQTSIHSQKYGTGTPSSIIYSNGKNIVEKPFANPTLNYSIVLFQENTLYYCRLMDRELANSLLVKMYFFRGQGLKLFKPISIQSSMTGREEVFVFELNRDLLGVIPTKVGIHAYTRE